MGGNANSGRKPKPVIDPMTGLELPANVNLPARNSFVVDASLDRLNALQKEIAKILPGENDEITALLTWAATHFETTEGIRQVAGTGKRGPKPHIDIQWLLIECSQIFSRVCGDTVEQVLDALLKVTSSETHVDWQHPVIRWAGAVQKVIGADESDNEISRRQIEGAIARYAANAG